MWLVKTIVISLAFVGFSVVASTPTIGNVTAQQRYPWNGKVDISYTVIGDIAEEVKQRGLLPSLKVKAIDMTANTTNMATALSGDTGLSEGTHSFVWDMDAEGLAFKSSNVVFHVACEVTNALYYVIDLSAGTSATSYPVVYLAEPPSGGFNTDEYKTTKLVLRRIEAGTFIMGEDQTDESHRVTLTKPFYCGIFEVTQKQYALVMGQNPSSSKGDTRPLENVAYDDVRGVPTSGSPISSEVKLTSFMGVLRKKAGVNFDLPTEAQWEYACRAGTTSYYNNGGSAKSDLDQLGRYSGNIYDGKGTGTQHTTVGSYQPNVWGLYDMHGNVGEFCLDWLGSQSYGINPRASSSSTLQYRGGAWQYEESDCTSHRRLGNGINVKRENCGFRIILTLSN